MGEVELGVVVLAYGAGGEYHAPLRTLAAEGVPPESIVVVHNPARRGEPSPVAADGIEVIQASHNLGYAAGMNLGIERQLERGVQLILLLTHDAGLRPGSVGALLDAARREPGYAVLGPALVLAGSDEPFSFGGVTRANGSVTHLREAPIAGGDGIAACDWVDGGTMLVRSDVLGAVGGFDERLWSYCEEADLCLRAKRAGYGIGVVLDATAEQAPGGSNRVSAWAYLLTRNGIVYGARAAGARGAVFMTSRALWISVEATTRAAARGLRLRRGDPAVPWAEAAGAMRGVVDALRRRWGPPPRLPGPGDVTNTEPPPTADRERVLHMGPAFEVGGGMSNALRALVDSPLGHLYELEVLPTYRSAQPLRRVTVYLGSLLRLVAWRMRRRGRIVHVHATVRGSMYRKSALILLARALGSRVVVQVHSGPGDVATFVARSGAAGRALFRAGLGAADVRLAVSRASADAIERCYGVEGVGVVPNAAPRRPRSATREGRMRALYLGGFANRAKGGDVLVAALARPEAAGLNVIIAGPGELPEAGREILSTRPEISWRGWLGDRDRLEALGEADAFVLSSRSEGLPMALLEAMASGLAIVAARVGGVPDVLEDGRDALLVAPEDPAALAEALVRIDGDAELRARLGAAARDRAGELDEVAVADRLAAIYAELG